MKIATLPRPTSPQKSHPPLSQQPSLKVEILSSLPFWKIFLEVQPPLAQHKGGGGQVGAHTMERFINNIYEMYLYCAQIYLCLEIIAWLEGDNMQLAYYRQL